MAPSLAWRCDQGRCRLEDLLQKHRAPLPRLYARHQRPLRGREEQRRRHLGALYCQHACRTLR